MTEEQLEAFREYIIAEIQSLIQASYEGSDGYYGYNDTEAELAESLFQHLKNLLINQERENV